VSEVNKYILPDGLMALEPGKISDNGILWLTYYYYLTEFDDEAFLKALESTAVKGHPGLYKRHSGETYINSMDNYQAIAAGLIMLKDQEKAKKLAEEILSHYPILNDQDPGNLAEYNRHRPAGIIQPHVWMMIYLAARRQPTIFQIMWYCGNLLNSVFILDRSGHWSTRKLAWLRIKATIKASLRINEMLWLPLKVVINIYIWRMERKSIVSTHDIFKASFKYPHPININAPISYD